MPNVTGVRLTHGSQEIGKDVVFYSSGAFDGRLLVACVIKNTRITGSADSDHGARAVYAQAEQALDTPVANPATGQDERVTQVFIISPHECAPATVDSIKGKLRARPGQVMFVRGRELLEKFEKYYEEFLLFTSGLYGLYFTELQTGLDTDPAVVNVLFRHGFMSGPRRLTELYVPPRFSCILHWHEMTSRVPSEEALLGNLSLGDSDSLHDDFRQIGRLVAVLTMPAEDGLRLQESFNAFAIRIKSEWQSGYESLRQRTDIPIEQRTAPKHLASVPLPTARELKLEAHELLTKAEPILAEFRKILARARQFATTKFRTPLAALESPFARDYCQVEAVSRLVPEAVRIDSNDDVIQFDDALMESAKADLFITGAAGFGKTSFCKWQTIDALKKFRDSRSKVIPIYIPLYQYASGELGSFESTFMAAPELSALWRQRASKGYEFRLYLDGLDEVPSPKRQDSLLKLAFEGKDAEPKMAIVVTGRDHVAGTHLKRFVLVHACEFDEQQVSRLAKNWFRGDDHSVEEFFGQLDRVASLKPLMRVPLLATLVLGVYGHTKTLPQSRVSLYDMFVTLLAGGWDIAKNVQRDAEFKPGTKLTVLTQLAVNLHQNRKRDCSQSDFRNVTSRTLPGLKHKWEQLLGEILRDGLLVSAGLECTFAHLSFQEYLTAKGLLEPTGRKALQALRNFLMGDDWWREVIVFFVGLSSDPKEVENFIRRNTRSLMTRYGDQEIKRRGAFLLETLTATFPDAQPNFAL